MWLSQLGFPVGIQLVEAGDAAKHPTVNRTALPLHIPFSPPCGRIRELSFQPQTSRVLRLKHSGLSQSFHDLAS